MNERNFWRGEPAGATLFAVRCNADRTVETAGGLLLLHLPAVDNERLTVDPTRERTT